MNKLDPEAYLGEFKTALARLISAGGGKDYDQTIEFFMEGLARHSIGTSFDRSTRIDVKP